jgi:hypothetical protein
LFCLALFCFIFHDLFCLFLSCFLSCHDLFCLVYCLVVSCLVLACRVLSCLVLSKLTTTSIQFSCLVLSHSGSCCCSCSTHHVAVAI